MNFLADESVDYNIFKALKLKGYEIEHVLDLFPGVSDVQVVSYAFKNKSIILTEDKDFGELIIRFKMDITGVILMRFVNTPFDDKSKIVLNAFEKFRAEMHNSLTVISDKKIRIKKISNS